MSPEHCKQLKQSDLSTKDILNIGKAGLLTLGSLIISAPFRRLDNTIKALNSLKGEEVNCFNGIETEFSNYDFDAIVVLGGGIDRLPNGNSVPSRFQKAKKNCRRSRLRLTVNQLIQPQI